MDRVKNEIEAVEEAVEVARQAEILELNSLQLALVGGGAGDTIMH